MKRFYILLFIALISCDQSSNKNHNSSIKSVLEENKCNNERTFGDISVCIVEIDGMIECYSNPKVKSYVNESRFEGNEILGIYFNKETYSKINNLGNFTYDDYFKIYADKKRKGIKVGESELDQMMKLMDRNYIKENWNNLKSKIEKNHEYLSFGRPILLESYKPNNRIRSLVFLIKTQEDNLEKIMVSTINMAEIKQRLICYAYYKDYEGEESIKQAKAKSDYFGFLFTDENQ